MMTCGLCAVGWVLLLLELRERRIEDFGVEVERCFGGCVIGWCLDVISQQKFPLGPEFECIGVLASNKP